MLVQFSITNYRSIKNKITLSMVASVDDSLMSNTISVDSKTRLLRSAAIYGANASGKTNVIRALSCMRNIVMESHRYQRNEQINVEPFLLSDQNHPGPTEFEIVFIKNETRYVYGMSVDHDRVYEEWLNSVDLANDRQVPKLLFNRILQADGHYEQKFGNSWKPKKERIVSDCLENQLYLSKFAQNNHPIAGIVFDWLSANFRPMSSSPENTPDRIYTADICLEDINIKNKIVELLRDADLGISDFYVSKEPLKTSSKWQILPDTVKQLIEKDMASGNSEHFTHDIVVRHVIDGHSVDFDLSDESAGTQRLYALAGPFMNSLLAGNVLFVDELDSSLHPLLTRSLVEMVNKNTKSNFQFIFTTHDSTLLDSELFRRDQVWFTEKNGDLITDLYSLWDLKPRQNENYMKWYLAGRYGSIPFRGDFQIE